MTHDATTRLEEEVRHHRWVGGLLRVDLGLELVVGRDRAELLLAADRHDRERARAAAAVGLDGD